MKPQVLAVGKGSTSLLGRLSQNKTRAKLLNLRVGGADPSVADSTVSGQEESSTAVRSSWNRLLSEVDSFLETDCVVTIAGLHKGFTFNRYQTLLRVLRKENRLLLTFLCRYPEGDCRENRSTVMDPQPLATLTDFWLEINDGIGRSLSGAAGRSEPIGNRLNRTVTRVVEGFIDRINSAPNLTGELETLLSMSIDQKREFMTECCPWLG